MQPPIVSEPPETRAPTKPPTQATLPPVGPRALTVAIFVLGLGGLLFANSWKRDFWEPDESLFAQVSRTMEASGNWIVPQCSGVFLDLPPLAYWLPAGLHKLTGLDPRVAYRIPITLAAVASLCLTYVAGKRLFDGRIGFLALWIQASTIYFFCRSAWLDDDLIFSACVQLAITAFTFATRSKDRFWLAIPGWLGLAGACLSKSGLLAAGLVFGSLLVFLFIEGGFTAVRQGFKRIRFLPGLGLFTVITAPWFVAVAFEEGLQFWTQYLLNGHFFRIMSSPVDARPPYFYLVTLLWAFFPWTLFLPAGLLHGKDRLKRHGERFAFVWALFMLLALTSISAKKPGYLLVIWPPLSLVVAAAFFETRETFSVWEDLLRQGVSRALPALLKTPLILVLVMAGAYFGGHLEKVPDERVQTLLADRNSMNWALGLAVLASGVLFVVSGRVRKLVLAKEVTRSAYELACAAAFLLFAGTFFFAAANPFLSGRTAVEKLASQLPPGAALAMYGRKRSAVSYYAGEDHALLHLDYAGTRTPDDPGLMRLQEHLKQPGAAFTITSRAELEILRAQFPSLGAHLIEKAGAKLGWHEELVLLGNH